MQVTALITAGGEGKRMGGPKGKQFLSILGRPSLYYTIKAFEDCDQIDEIVLVVHPRNMGDAQMLVRQNAFKKAVVTLREGDIIDFYSNI